MMVKVLLYAYCVGGPSSRRMAQRLHEDIAFRVLAANNTPDFRTISDFRKDHLEALSGLFLQVLMLCQREGLVKLGHVALDGTCHFTRSLTHPESVVIQLISGCSLPVNHLLSNRRPVLASWTLRKI